MSQLELFPSEPLMAASALSDSAQTLPDYRVRESSRAKHVSIKISVEGEVEIVVPPQFNRKQLPEILERRRDWIIKTRSRLLRDRTQTAPDWTADKPDTIHFRWRNDSIDEHPDLDQVETWTVRYQPAKGNSIVCIPSKLSKQLTVRGNVDTVSACQSVLRKWLTHQAMRDLAPWLRQLGYDIDLPCNQISARGQKTIWASCSSNKNISLNYKLLFLPRPLVEYVMVHELCHTVHMNHSAAFWDLVEQKQPDFRWRKKLLKKGWRFVPRWVEKKS